MQATINRRCKCQPVGFLLCRTALVLASALSVFVDAQLVHADQPEVAPLEKPLKRQLLLRNGNRVLLAAQVQEKSPAIRSNDDYRDDIVLTEPDVSVEEVAVQRAKPFGPATANFIQTVYSGRDSTEMIQRQMEILRDGRVLTISMACDLTDAQKKKLELAAQGDVKHLFDLLQNQRRHCEKIDQGVTNEQADDQSRTNRQLASQVQAGPFGNGSLFLKTLESMLDGRQLRQFEAFLALERLGGRIFLRPRGGGDVKALRMTKPTLSDAGLVNIPGFTSLQALNLDYTQITDAGLTQISNLTNLEILELEATQVKGPGLANLSKMKSLELLDLRRCPVEDSSLIHLRDLTALRILQLSHTRVTGSGFRYLAELKNLESLVLIQAPVTDAGLSGVEKLTQLKELNLEGTATSDEGVVHLAGLTNLVTLDLRRTNVTDAGLEHLGDLKHLRTLYLLGSQVTPEGVALLERRLPAARIVR